MFYFAITAFYVSFTLTSEILSTFTQSADSLNCNARMLRLVLKESINSEILPWFAAALKEHNS